MKQREGDPEGHPLLLYSVVARLAHAHLLDDPTSATYLVDNEQYVADVADDVATQCLVELDVAHCREPSTVEVNTDKLTLAVEDW